MTLLATEAEPTQARVTVRRASEPMPGVRRLDLDFPECAARVRPGQFLHIASPGGFNFLRRPLDVLDADVDTGTVSLLFQVLGEGTAQIAALRAGDHADAMGPLGVGFSARPEVRRAVVLGGGLGVAPFPFLARRLRDSGVAVTWANGARNSALLYPDVPAGCEVIFATDDGSRGYHGSIVDAAAVSLAGCDAAYVCGPLPMLRAVARRREAGMVRPGVRVETAVEARMGCARGVCLGCVVPVRDRGYLRTCREGPVFEVGEIEWDRVADPGELRFPRAVMPGVS